MKVTVCELPNEANALETAWSDLVEHVKAQSSELACYRRCLSTAGWRTRGMWTPVNGNRQGSA
jgi:hypothetical protein